MNKNLCTKLMAPTVLQLSVKMDLQTTVDPKCVFLPTARVFPTMIGNLSFLFCGDFLGIVLHVSKALASTSSRASVAKQRRTLQFDVEVLVADVDAEGPRGNMGCFWGPIVPLLRSYRECEKI